MGSFVSERVGSIPTSGIRVIFEKANKMSGVVRLEVGEPDFDTPARVTAAAKRALDEGFTHYTSSAGIMPLREAISAKLKRENRVDADPGTEVVVTPGAGAAIYLSVMCTVNPGDEVLLPDPAWPHYEACINLAGGKVVRYPTHESLGFRPEMEEVAKLVTDRTKAILINSPSNPTGSVLGRRDLEWIADLARSKDLLVFSDEVYEKVMYAGVEHHSIASFDGMKDRTVTINALSKTYAMTGWRVGYAAARPEIAAQMAKLNLFTSGCPNSFAQVAAVEALTGPQGETQRMLEEYTRRRDLMVRRLNEMDGVSCPNPGGAFYAFPRVALRGMNAFDTSMFLLDNAKVATVPGSSFGELGENHLRLSYATSIENVSEGMDRIETAIRGASQKGIGPAAEARVR
jgi:aminotransferase